MSLRAEAFDRWIRTGFVEMNTALENLYFAQADRANVEGVGDAMKAELRDEGHAYVVDLQREGNTGEGFESGFGVLGNVGLYMGALRRHELTNPDREEKSPFVEASSLAFHVGASLGMAPRFATAHLATHNLAIAGVRKSFTSLADEFLFIDENTRGILSFQRTADALTRIVALGVSSPVADVLFEAAKDGLRDVIRFNARLFEKLDVDRFFFSVRPYYKPYRVGRQVYRGANAGDFSGINEIDLLLGLCRRERSLLCAAAGRQDAVHAARRPGAAQGMHDASQPARRVAAAGRRACGRGLVPGECARVSRGVRSVRRRPPPSITTSSCRASSSGRRARCRRSGCRDHGQRAALARADPLARAFARLSGGGAAAGPRDAA